MKKTVAIMVIFSIWFLLMIGLAYAQSEESLQTPHVTVYGTAEMSLVPDEIVLEFGVVSHNADLQLAKQRTLDSVRMVMEIAKKLSIPPENVQTDFAQIYPVFNPKKKSGQEAVFYRVQQGVTVVLKDSSKYEELLTSFINAGMNQLFKVDFRLSNRRTSMDRVRDMAVDAARQKASAMAVRLGQNVGKALIIEEQNEDREPNRLAGIDSNDYVVIPDGASFEGGSFSPGMITLKSRVKVVFELMR